MSILNIDPLGNWDEEPSEVVLDDITQVSFDTPCVHTLSKYLKAASVQWASEGVTLDSPTCGCRG